MKNDVFLNILRSHGHVRRGDSINHGLGLDQCFGSHGEELRRGCGNGGGNVDVMKGGGGRGLNVIFGEVALD